MNINNLFIVLAFVVEVVSIVAYIGDHVSAVGFFCISTSMALLIVMQYILKRNRLNSGK
jgi:hypothetical protein